GDFWPAGAAAQHERGVRRDDALYRARARLRHASACDRQAFRRRLPRRARRARLPPSPRRAWRQGRGWNRRAGRCDRAVGGAFGRDRGIAGMLMAARGLVGLNGLRRVIMLASPTTILLCFACLAAIVGPASAQDMMRYLDLSSPDMTEAEMTRADVEATLAAADKEHPAD